jgi:hypothetical protein
MRSGSGKRNGILKSQLAEERGTRAGNGIIDSRHSRFGGVFVKPIVSDSIRSNPIDKDNNDIDYSSGHTVEQQRNRNDNLSSRATAIVKRGVQIGQISHDLPTAATRTSRKSIAFAHDHFKNTVKSESLSRAGQEASVVMASVSNLLCESKGLNELIKRVNEDLRRDEGIFYGDMELVYFEILSKMLTFNRYKLMSEKAQFEKKMLNGESFVTQQNNADLHKKGWVPDLRNMIEATSNMSENRIVRSMEEIIKKKKEYHSLHRPVECFKELICYIQIELQSANLGHRDLAVAALFRIFYTLTTDRRDPLPKLLNDWKSSTYTKEYTQALIELLHETMKTLDLAQSIYSDETEIAKARKIRQKKGSTLDIEQYTAAAYRFDTNEYFKKLVNNGSVRMYTKLLEKYTTNEPSTNHYIYCFFQRLNNFQIEQTFPTPSPLEIKDIEGQAAFVPAPLTLGYLLFNLHTMNAFSQFLNDVAAQTNKKLMPLMSLAKTIVRRFGETAQKNHLLFAECLFQHNNPMKNMCEKIDGVYDAQAYKPGTASYMKAVNIEKKSRERAGDDVFDGEDSASDDENNLLQKADEGFVVGDEGDMDAEFDENADNMKAQPKNIKKMLANKQKKELEKIARKEARKAEKLENHRIALENGEDLSVSRKSKTKKLSSRSWSEEEDEILTSIYKQYAGVSSVFTIIKENESLRAIGMNRSEQAVQRRCKELDLHMTATIGSDDDNMMNEEFTQEQPKSGTKRPSPSTFSSLDLDEYDKAATTTSGSSSKKKKIQTKLSQDSDDDDDIFDDDTEGLTSSLSTRKGMVIDSDDE